MEISYETARRIIDEYDKYRHGEALPTVAEGQTKWVWFSEAEIGRLFEFLRKQYPHESPEHRGIKFYFSIYTHEEDTRPNDLNSYEGRLSFVMVPSLKKGELIDDSRDVAAKPSMFDNIGTTCPPRCESHAGDVF